MERPCILIIDDDPGLRKTLAGILRTKGVAAFIDKLPGKEILIRKADEALYRAKENGRKRVERSEMVEGGNGREKPGTHIGVPLPKTSNRLNQQDQAGRCLVTISSNVLIINGFSM